MDKCGRGTRRKKKRETKRQLDENELIKLLSFAVQVASFPAGHQVEMKIANVSVDVYERMFRENVSCRKHHRPLLIVTRGHP